MNNNHDFYQDIIRLTQDPDFQKEVAQIQSKALLTEITQNFNYKWTYIPHRIIRNITGAKFALETIVRNNTDNQIQNLSEVARYLAMIWESMAKLKEATSQEIALINAAINYEIAGYQANSICLARQINKQLLDPDNISVLSLTTMFLERRFVKLLEKSAEVQKEPDNYNGITLEFIQTLGMALLGKSITEITQFFLQGHETKYQQGIETLTKANELFEQIGLVEESNLTRSFISLLPILKNRTTWTILLPYLPNNDQWNRYLKLLARGLGKDLYESRSISELWYSQISALNKGLLDLTGNKIVKMPTSAGKTRIAEMKIVYTLINHPGSKCIYIAPYRALVSELEESFLTLFKDLGFKVATIIESYQLNDLGISEYLEADLLVITPERLDLLLRGTPQFLEQVRLFVLDEFHVITERSRGVKFELLLTRLKKKLPHAKILALSAVVSQQTIDDFALWLNATNPDDKLISSWRPSIQRYAKFEWEGDSGVIRYVADPSDQNKLPSPFVPGIVKSKKYHDIDPETSKRKSTSFPKQENKSEIAAELAYKFAELGAVLVVSTQPRFVRSVATALTTRLKLTQDNEETIPSYFKIGSNSHSLPLVQEWLVDPDFENWLNSGIGIHYGTLPDKVRKGIETDFRNKKLRVLIATNTLGQGVNLPIKTVIIHSSSRYNNQTEKSEPMSARDYWNIAGRAGRAREETQGLVIHICLKKQDDKNFDYYLEHRDNVEEVPSALFELLKGLADDRLSVDDLMSELDSEVLALLVEESTDQIEDLQPKINDILEGSLVKIQAERHGLNLDDLNTVLRQTGDNIKAKDINNDKLRLYSSTGLSSDSCQHITQHITQHQSLIYKWFIGQLSINDLIELIIPLCLSLDEIKEESNFINCSELLTKWVQGFKIKDILEDFQNDSDEITKIIDQLFGYHLPWIISSYNKIAIQVLGLSNTPLSPIATFFPSMVKFGVPTPEACWSMSMGIGFRETAMLMSSLYLNESKQSSYQNFLQWLTKWNRDRLKNDLGLSSPFLEDVLQSILLLNNNAHLSNFTNLREFLPISVEVEGIEEENRAMIALQVQVNQHLELKRDYDNLIDRNAIAIYLSNQVVGAIPSDIAQILAPEMDTGSSLSAKVINIVRKQIPSVTIEITLQS